MFDTNEHVSFHGTLSPEHYVACPQNMGRETVTGGRGDELQLVGPDPTKADIADIYDGSAVLGVVAGLQLRAERSCFQFGFARRNKLADGDT